MELEQAKKSFVQVWGTLGTSWGINRTMAQIHALLLISTKPLSTEDMMEELQMSRGNVNMNIRELMNWNLVYKELTPGDRKEYFKAEKDVWEVTKRIATERKRRELTPLINHLNNFEKVNANKRNAEAQEFLTMVTNLHKMINQLDYASSLLLKTEKPKLFDGIMKLFAK